MAAVRSGLAVGEPASTVVRLGRVFSPGAVVAGAAARAIAGEPAAMAPSLLLYPLYETKLNVTLFFNLQVAVASCLSRLGLILRRDWLSLDV